MANLGVEMIIQRTNISGMHTGSPRYKSYTWFQWDNLTLYVPPSFDPMSHGYNTKSSQHCQNGFKTLKVTGPSRATYFSPLIHNPSQYLQERLSRPMSIVGRTPSSNILPSKKTKDVFNFFFFFLDLIFRLQWPVLRAYSWVQFHSTKGLRDHMGCWGDWTYLLGAQAPYLLQPPPTKKYFD